MLGRIYGYCISKNLKRYDKKATKDIINILYLTAENDPRIEEICCNNGINKEELSGRVKALLGNLPRIGFKRKNRICHQFIYRYKSYF